jgi:hypothetical protein
MGGCVFSEDDGADWCYRRLAVDYCFLANDGLDIHPELVVDPFDAKTEQNDYEVLLVCIVFTRYILTMVTDPLGATRRNS